MVVTLKDIPCAFKCDFATFIWPQWCFELVLLSPGTDAKLIDLCVI